MSSPFAPGANPYASPAAPPVLPAGPPSATMDYMRAYNYIFENPAWMTTVLLVVVCSFAAFIPGVSILLNLLYLGYQFEVIDWLLRTQGRQYPTFEFGRIGDYLSRGLWPFLVNLVASIVVFPVLYIGFVLAVFAVAGLGEAGGDELGGTIALVLGGVLFVTFFAALVAFSLYLTGMILRSGLAQDFASGFTLSWVHDFVRRMWAQMLLAGLFLGATAFALSLLGVVACFIGVFFVLPLILLAYAHILYQLYGVYLTRGGMPVVLKTPSQLPMMGPPPQPPSYPPKPLP